MLRFAEGTTEVTDDEPVDRARKVDLAVGFRLLGNPSGEVERYVVRVTGGGATPLTGVLKGSSR